jgi:hypothetical protein
MKYVLVHFFIGMSVAFTLSVTVIWCTLHLAGLTNLDHLQADRYRSIYPSKIESARPVGRVYRVYELQTTVSGVYLQNGETPIGKSAPDTKILIENADSQGLTDSIFNQ